MLLKLRIKLRTPFLGDKRTKDRVRRFDRSKALNADIQVDLPHWYWALARAREELKLPPAVDVSFIRVESEISTPHLELFVRKWKDSAPGLKSEMFESVRAGTVLTYEVMLLSSLEPAEAIRLKDKRPPTVAEFTQMMEFIGHKIGLSPWGNRFGYGRFAVHEVLEA